MSAFARAASYLIFESISGRLLLLIASVVGLADAFRTEVARRVEWLVDSKAFQTLDDHPSREGLVKVAEA